MASASPKISINLTGFPGLCPPSAGIARPWLCRANASKNPLFGARGGNGRFWLKKATCLGTRLFVGCCCFCCCCTAAVFATSGSADATDSRGAGGRSAVAGCTGCGVLKTRLPNQNNFKNKFSRILHYTEVLFLI